MTLSLEKAFVSTLLKRAVDENNGFADKYGVGLNVDIDSSLDNICIDTDVIKFLQIMTNLISNAIKFSPKGESISISSYISSGKVKITITDNAGGIPEHFQERIFTKFSQADSSDTRSQGGTGLGLAISKELTEKLGGEIGFNSTDGEGTEFYLIFPFVNYKPLELKATTQTLSCSLVIEDDEDVSNLLKLLISQEQSSVDQALTGVDAINKINNNKYNLITLDLKLPDMSGLEVIEEIRRSDSVNKETPVIIVSGSIHADDFVVEESYEYLEFVTKPIDIEKLNQLLTLKLKKPLKKCRILHVEDDPDLCKIINLQLGTIVEMCQVFNLADAYKKLESSTYDCILLDLNLPDGHGGELIESLKDKEDKPIIIVLSANEYTHSKNDNVITSLIKSKTNSEELIGIVSKYLDRKEEDSE